MLCNLPNHTQNVLSSCIKYNGLGQPEVTSIRNSEVAAFREFCVLCSNDQATCSNPCQTKRPVYRGDRHSESWISESPLYMVWRGP